MAAVLVTTSGQVQAGPIGLLVVLALIGAAVLLFRSMTHQLRKVPPSFDPPPDEPDEPGPDGS